jgi:hypothetical protein
MYCGIQFFVHQKKKKKKRIKDLQNVPCRVYIFEHLIKQSESHISIRFFFLFFLRRGGSATSGWSGFSSNWSSGSSIS